MTQRKYSFPLPIQLSGIEDSVAVSDLQSAGLWGLVPANLQAKLLAADSWFSGGAVVTEVELNELPDPVWTYIHAKLQSSGIIPGATAPAGNSDDNEYGA